MEANSYQAHRAATDQEQELVRDTRLEVISDHSTPYPEMMRRQGLLGKAHRKSDRKKRIRKTRGI